MCGDRLLQDRVVARERVGHRILMPLPEPRAPFDIREQKRDRAARQQWRGRCSGHVRCFDRTRGRGKPIRSQLGASGFEEGRALLRRNLQLLGQQLRHLSRGPPLVGLDPPNRHLGAADARSQLSLGQVERLAATPHPVTE
jgi:hypothetical protein